MNKSIPVLLSLALLAALPASAEDPAPAPAKPSPAKTLAAPAAAVALAQGYIAALEENDLDRAVALVDMRSMRESLLKTRLTELRRNNPNISEAELSKIEHGLLLRELAPERLNGILKQILRNTRGTGEFSGTLAQVQPFAAGPDASVSAGEEAYIFLAEVVRDGDKGAVPIPVRRYGDDWQVALDLAEGISRQNAPAARAVPLPSAAQEAVDGFWTVWKEGSPTATHEMLPPAQRPPLGAYTAEVQAFADRLGAVERWEQNAPARDIGGGTLAAGFLVKGAAAESSVVMVLAQRGEAWNVVRVVFGPPPAPAPAPVAPKGIDWDQSVVPALTPPPAPAAE
jgi:hypothetical protein